MRKAGEKRKLAYEELRKANVAQKSHYDKNARARQLRTGDNAFFLLSTQNNKLLLQCKGAFLVLKRMNVVNYVVGLGKR